jgi:hypothetical protein
MGNKVLFAVIVLLSVAVYFMSFRLQKKNEALNPEPGALKKYHLESLNPFLKGKSEEWKSCLGKEPIQLDWEISGSGKASEITGPASKEFECLKEKISSWQFPEPGVPVYVNYNFSGSETR